jgi:hypothetical protein
MIIEDKNIKLNPEEVKDLIIKALYQTQGISGIFDVQFKVERKFIDSDYVFVFEGVDVKVDLNES